MRLALLGFLLAACEPATSLLDDQPGGRPVGPIDCGVVADKIRASYSAAQRAAFETNPDLARQFEITQQVIRESCEQDHWPEAVKQCALDAPAGQLAACNKRMPSELQQKMQDRMSAALNGT